MRVCTCVCLIGAVAVLLVISGCILTPGDKCEWMVWELHVDSVLAIPDTVALGEPVRFELSCVKTDGCSWFTYVGITTDDRDVYVTVYRKSERRQACPTAIDKVIVSGEYVPSAAGIYAFHFTRPQQSSIDTTVVVR